jgi:adenosine kinase
MHTILVSGSLAYDRIANFPDQFKNHFVPDRLHNINVSFVVDQLKDNWGGTAGNIAYNFSLLGEKATIIASVGNDFAPYREWLQPRADLSLLQELKDQKTATCHITTDQGNNQISAFYPGALGTAFAGTVPTAHLAIVAPSNYEDMKRLPGEYRAHKTSFFFDPGQMIPALSGNDLKNGLEGAEVVLVNDYELGMVMQKTGWDEAEILNHAKVLVVTLGEAGSRVITRDGETRVPAVHVEAVDPTGAGDAFRAGFATAWLQKIPLAVCAQVGCALASFAVESYGTQNHAPTLHDIQARYESSYSTWPLHM